MKVFIFTFFLLLEVNNLITAKNLDKSKNVKSRDVWLPRLLGTFHLKDAGFVEVYPITDSVTGNKNITSYADSYNLYITTFNAAAVYVYDPVYRIPSPGSHLDDIASWEGLLEKMGGQNTAYWPNYPIRLPKGVTGFDGILQSSGFIPPGKKYGQLEVYNIENGNGPWDIASKSQDGKDWAYHWAIWKDVDNDGLEDCITARFHVGTFGGTESQLIWLKNPGDLTPTNANGEWNGWEWGVLIQDGPDVYFEIETMYNSADGKTYEVLLTAELWTHRISLYYVEQAEGAWLVPENIKQTIIETTPGLPFEVNFQDLNVDGNMEIVVSYYDTESDGDDEGFLVAYEQIDYDWREPSMWQRHVIADKFVTNFFIFGNTMSPGKHRTFYPSSDYEFLEDGKKSKPWISLSGDDDGNHYIMYPKSEDPFDWEYDLQLIIETGETTAGTMAVLDLDGDGYTEIVSAGYSAGTVYVHTFAPE